jgi:hypothetical protein
VPFAPKLDPGEIVPAAPPAPTVIGAGLDGIETDVIILNPPAPPPPVPALLSVPLPPPPPPATSKIFAVLGPNPGDVYVPDAVNVVVTDPR